MLDQLDSHIEMVHTVDWDLNRLPAAFPIDGSPQPPTDRRTETWTQTGDNLTSVLNKLSNEIGSFYRDIKVTETAWSEVVRTLQVFLKDIPNGCSQLKWVAINALNRLRKSG